MQSEHFGLKNFNGSLVLDKIKLETMKKIISIIVMMMCIIGSSFSQKSEKNKIKVYKVWVTQLDGINYRGFYLYSADKNGIVITSDYISAEQRYTIDYSKILMIRMRRKGNVGRTALILGGAGAIVGGGLGFAAGDDPENMWFRADKEEKAAAGLIAGGVLGTGFGALFGSIREKMIINGDLENYMRHFPKLKKAQIYRE